MKKLKFTPDRIASISDGQKTVTWRLFDDKDLSIGDIFEIENNISHQIVGLGEIDGISIKYLKDLTNDDQMGNKTYNNLDEIIEDLSTFYGPTVAPDSIVKVVRFHKIDQKPTNIVDKKTTNITEAKLYTDGGSRGNPGPSASAYILMDKDGGIIERSGSYLGITTNNQAEYQAVRIGLSRAQILGIKIVHVFMDSLLVVNQMTGIYKIRNRDLWPIHQEIVGLTKQFEKVSFSHIPREMNKLADEEVNRVIDCQDMSGLSSELI
jgi:ribonuclease HI